MTINALYRAAALAGCFCLAAHAAHGDEPSPDRTPVDASGLFRPMTSISLSNALSTQDGDGNDMTTPASSARGLLDDLPAESHFTAAPWHRSHPPRNTYPIRHQPLYFEDPNLERCGQSAGCLTELTSVIHFGVRIPALPYLMASNCPHDCVSALPDCPTCQSFGPDAYWPRPTAEATAVQVAATVGWLFVIP